MVKYEIVSKSSEGKIRTYDVVEADSLGYTPAGFVLYIKNEIVYAIPCGCGVRKAGTGTNWDERLIDD